ncbi:MAG: UvrD-helicase domain-containing protein [Lachnospiraceae bacterium]|nr:UvrD-helicase domain-containing protein [Lachnospiraceae bacterium]
MDPKYSLLNDRQLEAVQCTEGPLLILAGAGSGKTRALTYRIAYLIEEMGVAPWNIMAITFTNKAAEEMKERVLQLVDYGDSIWVTTFHSTCVRILRRFIDRLGFDTDFTIYDADDQKTAARHAIKELDLDAKMYKERALVSYISDCKNEMLTPEDMLQDANGSYRETQMARLYERYQAILKRNNALDFDDLLLFTVRLFNENPDILDYYQERFRYILIDEYQDTNRVQFEFVWLLAKKYGNICVVGDDDQSIYRFRGADIRNILEFEDHFPGAKVVKLEQNYRSTTRILDCANAVISHNHGRKDKHLWSDLGEGRAVTFKQYETGNQEADEVIREIRKDVQRGASYSDYAILYRTNAQSRAFEERCVAMSVPYRMVGGVNFYQRAEIKDILAYLKTIAGGKDDMAVQRILNVPKRGIGQATVDKLLLFASLNDISLFEAVKRADHIPGLGKVSGKLLAFAHLIGELRDLDVPLPDLLHEVVHRTDYLSTLDALDEEQAEQKIENIEELTSKALDFENNWEGEQPPTLTEFLEDVALVADIDAVNDDEDRLLLMTIHGAKGLEFENVYLTGLEEGLFPSYMSMSTGDPMDIEEERRLCYVGITRAKRALHLTSARARMLRGDNMYNPVSRFVTEIPPEYLGLSTKKRTDEGFSRAEAPAPRPKPTPKESFGRTFEIKKASSLPYDVGDRVVHQRFGEGTVREITDGKKDFEVLIDFDGYGEKRMFASFAKLERI